MTPHFETRSRLSETYGPCLRSRCFQCETGGKVCMDGVERRCASLDEGRHILVASCPLLLHSPSIPPFLPRESLSLSLPLLSLPLSLSVSISSSLVLLIPSPLVSLHPSLSLSLSASLPLSLPTPLLLPSSLSLPPSLSLSFPPQVKDLVLVRHASPIHQPVVIRVDRDLVWGVGFELWGVRVCFLKDGGLISYVPRPPRSSC